MTDLVRELIDQAELVCETVRHNPCDCEGCMLFNWDLKEDEEFECPMQATIEALEIAG